MSQQVFSRRIILALLFAATIVAILLGILFRDRPEDRYDQQILAAARRYHIDPGLIKAVIWQESRFNPSARGKAGEIGLMQVREDAAFEWADDEHVHPFWHERILDPEINILCGTHYLAKLMQRYKKTDNPAAYALADYNAGRTHVLRWNKGAAQTNSVRFFAQMDYPGTRQYALNILERWKRYQRQFASRASKGAVM
jgi:soluble lytic murein transglycosylase